MDSKMGVLKIVLTVLFIIVCLALVVLVLMQEGKSAGLGSISGAAGFLLYVAVSSFSWSDRYRGGCLLRQSVTR